MEKNTALHSFILIVAVFLTFFWVSDDSLSYLSLQLTAALLLTLVMTHKRLSHKSFRMLESVISTVAVLLIVATTGGIASPFFFLNFVLLFELSFLLEPAIPFILSAALVLFYYLFTSGTDILAARWLELAAFPFMTPLAYFLGKIYRREENQKKEIAGLENKVEKLEERLVEEELSDINRNINKIGADVRKKAAVEEDLHRYL